MKSNPEVIELDEADLVSKLDQIEAVLGMEMAQPFRQLLRWYAVLLGLLREKKFSLQRLRKMLFGASTERTSQVLPSPAEPSGPLEKSVGRESCHRPGNFLPDRGPRSVRRFPA
ncbi:MAG: hypothetical protein NTY19_26690 [Planctomycetota bacterium]|nr:hypothetical protein [Planctomycetota bacterium]